MSDTHTIEHAGQTPPPQANGNGSQVPAVQAAPRRQEVRVVSDPVPVLDTARFEHMQRVANVMAFSSLIPDALCKTKDDNGIGVWLPERQVLSNCFMVVNQAVRWGMDPFAVAQCVSVVKGKLCYEGKLIAAVIKARLGADLEYKFEGEGENMRVTVTATKDGKTIADLDGTPKSIEGSVKDWRTTHSGSPWSAPGGSRRMLRYRGAREWGRVYEPALMLGVYSDDEMEENDRRFQAARDVTQRNGNGNGNGADLDDPPSARAAISHQVTDSPSTAPATEPEAPVTARDDEPPSASKAVTTKPDEPKGETKPQADDGGVPDFLRREAETKKAETAAADGIPPASDIKAFLAWVDKKLSSIPLDFADAFPAMVDGEIRSRMEGMFPADREDVEGLIRKHEARLAP